MIRYLLFLFLVSFIALVGCNRQAVDNFPETNEITPGVVPLNLDSGYVIHPFTKDSTDPYHWLDFSGKWTKWSLKKADYATVQPPKKIKLIPDSVWVRNSSVKKITHEERIKIEPVEIPLNIVAHALKIDTFTMVHPKPFLAGNAMFRDNRSFDIRYWDSKAGLSAQNVMGIAVDSRGDVWVSLFESGVIRFDGNYFYHYNIENGLPGFDIRGIFEDRDGNIWFAADKGSLAKYDGDKIYHYTYKDITNQMFYFHHVRQDNNGDMWFIGRGLGVNKIVGDTAYCYTNFDLLTENQPTFLEFDSKNRWWAAGSEGNLYRYEDGKLMRLIDGTPEHQFRFSHLFEDADGNNWLSTFQGFMKYEDGELIRYPETSDLLMHRGHMDEQIIWCTVAEKGVVKFNYHEMTFQVIEQSDGFPDRRLVDFCQLPDGSFMSGTLGRGFVNFNPNFWQHFNQQSEDAVGRPINPVDLDNGVQWLGVDAGICKISGDTMKYFGNKTNRHPFYEHFSDIIEMKKTDDNQVWAIGRGVFRIKDEEITLFDRESGLRHIWCRTGFIHQDSSLWFGDYNQGICVIKNDEIYYFTDDSGEVVMLALAMFQDSKERIWIGNYFGGVTMLQGDSMITYTDIQGLIHNDIRSFAEDKFGHIWIGTNQGGVARFDGEEFLCYNTDNGLPSNIVDALATDQNGNIWMGTRNGLCYLKYDENATAKDYPQFISLGYDEGIIDKMMYYHCVKVDETNTLVLANSEGYSKLNIDAFDKSLQPATVTIGNVLIGDQMIDYGKASEIDGITYSGRSKFTNQPKDLVLTHNHAQLRFEFSSTAAMRGNIRYAYYLDGVDKKWSQPSSLPYAEYRGIPYGEYTFHVRNIGVANQWSDEATFHFTILPPWWHTWWARTLYVLIFVLVMYSIMKIRTRNLLKKQADLENKIDLATQEIKYQHEEIMDSIAYAKRIQSAILPPKKLVKEYLQDSFILYKPKDVVAGDFYWMEKMQDTILFAAADCTGHGVPGAMVSVICNNGLNRAVNEFGLHEPGKILDKTRELVIKEFEKSEDDVKDGMDIALCALNGNKLKYAGAHNPLWIIRKGSEEIEEIKADKQPIGKYINQTSFTTHEVELQKGDTIYIFSDGFSDQFGGENGKKLKASNLKKMLLSMQNHSMTQQMEMLDEKFEKWRGDLMQLDDVCVIGVRV